MPGQLARADTDHNSSSVRQQQLLDSLQQRRLMTCQRQQQHSGLLSLLIQRELPPEITNWNPLLDISLDVSDAISLTSSEPTFTLPVWAGRLPNDYPDQQCHQHGQFEVDEISSTNAYAQDLDDMPMANSFVRKLHRMLTDPTFQSYACWGPKGDTLIVKNVQEFPESVLPRLFKHKNFSSFVRQLNKYGFRKVNPTQGGEGSWTFQHPDFRSGNLCAFEKIKRRPSIAQRSAPRSGLFPPDIVLSGPATAMPESTSPIFSRESSNSGVLFPHTGQPTSGAEDNNFGSRLATLEHNHGLILAALRNCKETMAEREEIIQDLILRFSYDYAEDTGSTSQSDSGMLQERLLSSLGPPQFDSRLKQTASTSSSNFRLIQQSFNARKISLSFPK